MSEITRADLESIIDDLKDHINERFESHEKVEAAMFAPVKEKVDEHDILFNGKDGRSGIVVDINTIKTSGRNLKWLAGGGYCSTSMLCTGPL